jgi:dolichol-phosphate mannosyltransferase
VVQLSIVMPAHNEGAHIEACVDEWYRTVVSRVGDAELLVVDDCSTDGTAGRLAALAARLPALRVLRTPTNGGHGRAVRLGLEHAVGTFVFQTDSDRQHVPDDFWSLWERRDEADFVFGVREQRADGRFRLVVSTILRGVNAILWQRWIRDANCPFKLMRRDALGPILASIPRDSFIPMVMVSILARHGGCSVIELPVRHFPRLAGQQSLRGLAKWSRTGVRCARELVALRLANQRAARAKTRSGAHA